MPNNGLVLDLSRNNAEPDWNQLGKICEGVILKLTEGASYNPVWSCGPWAAKARQAGLRVGFYHFARPSGGDAVAEARNFASAIKRFGGCQRRDFRPALDMEATVIDHERLYAWSRAFNQELRNQDLPTPMFYTYPYFLSKVKPPKPIGNGLWFANYTGKGGYITHSFAPWQKVHLHQYTSVGYVRYPNGVIYPTRSSDGRRHLDKNKILARTALLAHPILGQV